MRNRYLWKGSWGNRPSSAIYLQCGVYFTRWKNMVITPGIDFLTLLGCRWSWNFQDSSLHTRIPRFNITTGSLCWWPFDANVYNKRDTVDGSQIQLTSWYSTYPMISRFFLHLRWLFGISFINSIIEIHYHIHFYHRSGGPDIFCILSFLVLEIAPGFEVSHHFLFTKVD